jgi:hypothetical protein
MLIKECFVKVFFLHFFFFNYIYYYYLMDVNYRSFFHFLKKLNLIIFFFKDFFSSNNDFTNYDSSSFFLVNLNGLHVKTRFTKEEKKRDTFFLNLVLNFAQSLKQFFSVLNFSKWCCAVRVISLASLSGTLEPIIMLFYGFI